MKKKLNKLDFLEINRRMNNNFNGSWQFMGGLLTKLKKAIFLNWKEKEIRVVRNDGRRIKTAEYRTLH